jgi:hypothetical protein
LNCPGLNVPGLNSPGENVPGEKLPGEKVPGLKFPCASAATGRKLISIMKDANKQAAILLNIVLVFLFIASNSFLI